MGQSLDDLIYLHFNTTMLRNLLGRQIIDIVRKRIAKRKQHFAFRIKLPPRNLHQKFKENATV